MVQKVRVMRDKLIRLQENWCFFCYRQMEPVEANTRFSAQLFHLDDKYAPWKGKFNGHIRCVVACQECCREISDKRTANIPISELHRRSGRGDGTEIAYTLAPGRACLGDVWPTVTRETS